MNAKVMSAYRMIQRQQAMVDRGGPAATCDICNRDVPSEYHEIVNRGRTINNDRARYWSYQKEICSLLCRNCHQIVHNPGGQELLLARNIQRYGLVPVLGALNLVKEETQRGLGIHVSKIFLECFTPKEQKLIKEVLE